MIDMTALTQDALGAAALAVLELEAASVGPFLLSRPFVVGPLVGAFFGHPLLGGGLGVAIEAVTIEELPLGGRLDLSAPVAAGVAAWLAAGPEALAVEAAFPVGLASGWVHARVERALRARRGVHARRVEASLAAGRGHRLGRELASSIGLQTAATFAVTLAAVCVLGPLVARLWPVLPEMARAGAQAVFLTAPWLGAGGLAASLWSRA
ncbi:MAG: hypothetical protein A2X40_06495 [Elusimicrobia bacterium GWC2_65_9]|nr:MAG: hypothetical protein A2X37_04590 [Elusimicrobia bacterium GWA2_66_18]OGR74053.1 MAG: hypothetical protein A2X40_06495 [Elusimicrobia bacterium GWC2_65_9]